MLLFVDSLCNVNQFRANQRETHFRKQAPPGVTLDFHINGSFSHSPITHTRSQVFIAPRSLSIWCCCYDYLHCFSAPRSNLPRPHASLAQARHWLAEDSSVDFHLFQLLASCHPDSLYCFRSDPQCQNRCISRWPATTCPSRASNACRRRRVC